MKRFWILLILMLAGLLSSCAPDPRDEADAKRTLILTAQDVADRELARHIKSDEAAIKTRSEQAAAERWNRVADKFAEGVIFGAKFSGAVLIIAFGIGVSIALVGLGQATRQGALLRANLIPLDRVTRQYPLLRQYVVREDGKKLLKLSSGIWILSNPNDNSVILLDERREGDRQKIAGMIAVQTVGIMTSSAQKAKDSNSEGVSMIAPAAAQIITANTKYLEADNGK